MYQTHGVVQLLFIFVFCFFDFGWGGRNTNNIRASRSTVINRAIFDVETRTRASKMLAAEETLISLWTRNLQETLGKKISILDNITIIIIKVIIIIRYVLPTHAYTGRYVPMFIYIHIITIRYNIPHRDDAAPPSSFCTRRSQVRIIYY